MAALAEYASERFIEISPLVQGLGHATYILKHQQYSYLRELPDNRWTFCPMHDGGYPVLFDLYRDAMDATPGSKYLHIGGDEIGNIGLCPRCKPVAEKEGIFALNLYWLNRVCEFVYENGRIPIFWDDMPLKYAGLMETVSSSSRVSYNKAKAAWDKGKQILDETVENYPRQSVFMRWNYSMALQPGNIMTLKWYKEKGLKTMIATAAHSGSATIFPFDDRENDVTSRGIKAIKSFIELAAEYEVDGCLATAWDDRSPHMETYWRGFIASAEYSWRPKGKTLMEFDLAYLQKEFGTTIPQFDKLYKKMRGASVFWEKAFMENGSRIDLENALFELPGLAHWLPPHKHDKRTKKDYGDLLIQLPNPHEPGAWSKRYADRLNEACIVINNCNTAKKELSILSANSKKNRYHWEIYSGLNDFIKTAPELLLALKACDTDNKLDLTEGISNVNIALENFNRSWNNLKEIYSKTRFLSNPANYVPDRYFHYASQREDLSWMIQVEEEFHKHIQEWLNSMKHNIKQ
jgi:hypothetical protein